MAALEYLHGAPKLVVPDNPRTDVDRACRYEPDLNRTYQEMAAHYGVAVMPVRPYKPRDMPCFRTMRQRSGACAPDAARTPISGVRRATE